MTVMHGGTLVALVASVLVLTGILLWLLLAVWDSFGPTTVHHWEGQDEW